LSLRGEELRLDGQEFDPNITGSITSATLVRAMDEATSLELVVNDPDMRLLLSGALTRPGKPSKRQDGLKAAAWDRFARARLSLDGYSFTLAGNEGRYDTTPFETALIFEDTVATLMRLRSEAVKASRGDRTRAEFVGMLVSRALKGGNFPFSRADRFYSPQAGQKQKIKQPEESDREKGINPNKKLTVKGVRIDAEQRKNLETGLAVCDALRSGERATLAWIVAVIQESTVRNLTGGDRDSSGILQVRKSTAVTIKPQTVYDPRTGNMRGSVYRDDTGRIAPGSLDPRDVKAVTRVFLLKGFWGKGGAIKIATDNPDMEPGDIAQDVQGSGHPEAYHQWTEEAEKILEAWGGAGTVSTLRESYEFRAGGRRNGTAQNYYEDSGNLAQDVRWRRFVDLNRLWFVNDEWLFSRRPIFVIDGEDGPRGLADQGLIGGPAYQVDVGLPLSEIRQQCFLPRWGGPPGGVVEYVNFGPLTGRWLIWSNQQDLTAPDEVSTLTLRRPEPTKAEPAPSTRTTVRTESRPEAGTLRAEIVRLAKAAYADRARYRYLQKRPMNKTIFPDDKVSIIKMDCSEFVTKVYEAAGAEDPNGAGYNGTGYTGTLVANATRTNDPQPGDLCFYGSGPPYGHVGIYIGDGQVIEQGGTPGPLKLKVKYRNDFAGYWKPSVLEGE